MAANVDPNKSTMASTSEKIPSEEELPVVEVFKTSDGVVLKWGEGGAQQTTAGVDASYTTDSFHAVDSNGDEPFRKTFGTLLGCHNGVLTIGETRYRIQAKRQQETPDAGPPPRKLMRLSDESWLSLSVIPLQHPKGPDTFVTQDMWLENMIEELADLCLRGDSDEGTDRVPLTSLARCSRGGKTRALLELSKGIREKKKIPTLFVSFNDFSDCTDEILRGDTSLTMLCRRIAFAARPQTKRSNSLASDFKEFKNFIIPQSDVLTWLGDQRVVLLVDELNRVKLDPEIVNFLKANFCVIPGRYFVFSSHLSSTNPENAAPSKSFREMRVVDLPLIHNLARAREALCIGELTPRLALYYGLIPALLVTSLTVEGLADVRQVKQRVQNAITSLPLDFALFQKMVNSFFTGNNMELSIDVLLDASAGRSYWIPCYLLDLLERLGSSIGGRFGRSLLDIAQDVNGWSTCKEGSGDGWESLFLLVLFLRFAAGRTDDVDCLPDISFNATAVSTLSSQLYYNYPFPSEISIAKIENVVQLKLALDKIQENVWVGDFPKVSIYYPKRANFAEYDVFVCVWQRDATSGHVTKEFYGYQLKEGKEIPVQKATLRNSYLVRGRPAQNSSKRHGWKCLARPDLQVFFGLSGKRWLPEKWRGLTEIGQSG